jgi:DNA-binding beta-propeller fold protein YncE
MDENRFDAIARALTTSRSRRTTLRTLLGTLLGAALPRLSPDALAADKGKEKAKGKGHTRAKHDRPSGRDAGDTKGRRKHSGKDRDQAPSNEPTDEPPVTPKDEPTPEPGDESTVTERHALDTAVQPASGEATTEAVSTATCLPPGAKPCRTGSQCCSGRCKRKKRKCLPCLTGTTYCAAQQACIPGGGCCTNEDCPADGDQTCQGGRCACPSNRPDTCDGRCVDLQTAASHCGSCANSCAEGEACVVGGCVAAQYSFVGAWGSQGDGDGQFRVARGLATDADGYVYVADAVRRDVQKFQPDGTLVTRWSTQSSDDGRWDSLFGVAVDREGRNVYVVHGGDVPRIKWFHTVDGLTYEPRGEWGSRGSEDGQFRYPEGVAIGDGGHVYVADMDNYRVQKFTADGVFVTKWGREGGGNGEFGSPTWLAADARGNIVVVDYSRERIQKFTADGAFMTKWGGYGLGDGQFSTPAQIAVDADGNVYVTDDGRLDIQKFTPDGAFVANWGRDGEGKFETPRAVAVGTGGRVYVVDSGVQVKVFEPL